jgi:uroporphyrin-III C-methyltransferase/precorrin-2 dehydrogenase/sirohydrochlorin ferrochelatase
MDQLPIFMNLRGRTAVVVGGGAVASRKAALLARCGVRLRIVSPSLSPAMQQLAQREAAETHLECFADGHLDGADLVVAATDDAAVNAAVHATATRRHLPVNVVDTPALCSFTFPAIVDRSPVTIAVSTGGRSPVLARYVKAMLERDLPAGLGRLAEFLGRWRPHVARRLGDNRQRRRFWEALLDGPAPELVYAGQDAQADRLTEASLTGGGGAEEGRVYLIGAGPGDPELLTLRAQRLLQRADVVLYDRLVPVGVLDLCRRDAEFVYVGKRIGDHSLPQADITELLVAHARQGKRVARLKGGDPFVFGRGGEEIERLAGAGIGFEVVPGVSAANGCAAYAGIPLTHRDHAHSVSFHTGHTKDGRLELDWPSMVHTRQTLVFYMGGLSAALIAERLIAHGMAPTTPAAIVEAGTTAAQKVHRTSLRRLAQAAARVTPGLPSLVIVGSVVNLQSELEWFSPDGEPDSPVFPAHRPAQGRTHGTGTP